MEVINTPEAPAAIGPYSQAIECRSSSFLFLSGQIPLDPKAGGLVGPDIKEQTRQVLKNLDAILLAAGLARWNVVKTTIYLVNLQDFGTVNEIYSEYFGEHKPARSTVQVAALPKGALIEIEAIAAR